MVYILYNGAQRGLLFAKFLFLYTNAAKSSLSTVPFFFPFLFLSSGGKCPQKDMAQLTLEGWLEERREKYLSPAHQSPTHDSHWLNKLGATSTKTWKCCCSVPSMKTEQKNIGRWIWEKMPDKWHGFVLLLVIACAYILRKWTKSFLGNELRSIHP